MDSIGKNKRVYLLSRRGFKSHHLQIYFPCGLWRKRQLSCNGDKEYNPARKGLKYFESIIAMFFDNMRGGGLIMLLWHRAPLAKELRLKSSLSDKYLFEQQPMPSLLTVDEAETRLRESMDNRSRSSAQILRGYESTIPLIVPAY